MLNKAFLMGRLTRDPELRYTQTGIAVCSFSIAVDRNYQKNKEQKQTDFINIVAWRQTAEFISKYFTKGRMIVVCGSIQTRTWEGNDGKKNYATEIIAEEVYFGDSKKDGDSSPYFPQPPEQNRYAPSDSFGTDVPPLPQDMGGSSFIPIDTDDDLPF